MVDVRSEGDCVLVTEHQREREHSLMETLTAAVRQKKQQTPLNLAVVDLINW